MIKEGFIKDGKLFVPDETLNCSTCAFAHAQCWTICQAFATSGGMREVVQPVQKPSVEQHMPIVAVS